MSIAQSKPRTDLIGYFLPGLLFVIALSAIAIYLGKQPFVKENLHFSELLIVILLGMLWRSVLPIPQIFVPGIRLAQGSILKVAVAGLGLKLTLAGLWAIGAPAILVVIVTTTAALLFGWWLARAFGLSEKMGLLLGVGGAICGASAVVAADSVVQGEKTDSAASIGVITLLGTLSIVLYPILFHAFSMNEFHYGLWTGASVHEVAQVVAAGSGVSEYAKSVASVTKLARICLLAPVVFYLASLMRPKVKVEGEARAIVPWFLIAFVVLALLNSVVGMTGGELHTVLKSGIDMLLYINLWLLCIGMAGVGLQAGFKDLKAAGYRPILVGALQWVFLALISFVLGLIVVRSTKMPTMDDLDHSKPIPAVAPAKI